MRIVSLFLLHLVLVVAIDARANGYRSITPLEAPDYNKNSLSCCFIDWGVSGWLSQDREFPDAQVYDVKTEKMLSIRDLVKDRPIVLEMGSVTCPSYDLNVTGMKALAEKYKGKVDFYTLYVRENHPNEKYKMHTTMEQKIAYAKDLVKLSHLNQSVLVDDVKGSLHQSLGNFGNAVFLVGKDMRTNHWSIFFNPKLLEKGIDSLMSAGGIAANAKFVGGTDIHPLAQKGYSMEEKKLTLQRMGERGEVDKKVPYETLVANYDRLGRPAKEMFEKMPASSRDGIMGFLKAASTNGFPATLTDKPMVDMQQGFRAEYNRRYEAWKQLNKIDDKRNVVTEQLKTPQ